MRQWAIVLDGVHVYVSSCSFRRIWSSCKLLPRKKSISLIFITNCRYVFGVPSPLVQYLIIKKKNKNVSYAYMQTNIHTYIMYIFILLIRFIDCYCELNNLCRFLLIINYFEGSPYAR